MGFAYAGWSHVDERLPSPRRVASTTVTPAGVWMAPKIVQSSPLNDCRRRCCRWILAAQRADQLAPVSTAHCVSAVNSTSFEISVLLESSLESESSMAPKRKSLLARARRLRMRERSTSGPYQSIFGSTSVCARLMWFYGLWASNGPQRLLRLRLARYCSIASICDSSGDGPDERRERASASSRSSAGACVDAIVGIALTLLMSLQLLLPGQEELLPVPLWSREPRRVWVLLSRSPLSFDKHAYLMSRCLGVGFTSSWCLRLAKKRLLRTARLRSGGPGKCTRNLTRSRSTISLT
jgi:hypothetical protein